MVRRPSARALAVAVALAAAVPALAVAGPSAAGAPECPAGTVLKTGTSGERAFEGLDDAVGPDQARCLPAQRVKVEPFADYAMMAAQRNQISSGPLGVTPPGALRAAIAGQARLQAAAGDVPGAQGTFRPLGDTPWIADDENAPNVNTLGLADQAGRVDSLVYDDVNDRLFSAPGTGGVWMSEDVGASWRSVGDALPYQSVGAVDWSPAGTPADGTLLVLSGEASAGGNVYTGIGAFWSDDSGASWNQATGIPDGLMGFEIDVDPTNPNEIYAATSQGLFRSTDAGRSYVNVVLPTGECAGVTGYDNVCQNANWVTDVEIRAPEGVNGQVAAGTVIAAVGYRAGRLPYPGTDTPQSPANGLYRSATGAPGSFEYLDDVFGDGATPAGFAPQERVGRTELGSATGPGQNHDYLYAIVQDAVLFNGGVPGIDAFDDTQVTGGLINNTALNGIYVSADFGASWTRMADEIELQSPVTESALVGTSQLLFYAPGVQSWYNEWIEPDPTMADASGVPTRLVFGLEEVWESRFSGQPQNGDVQQLDPISFKVIGPYFADDTCAFLDNPLPVCATQQTASGDLTTHPDQQAGVFVPRADGGVSLVVGNDGGTYVQTVGEGEAFTKEWGRGAQDGVDSNTLLPYDAEVAKDGTVAIGLQDNGSGSIDPDGRAIETFGGDGFYTAIDPDNSDVQYNETTFADMRVTTDRGVTYRGITPPVSSPSFANPFVMDPTDPNHLLTAGPEVVETLDGPETQASDPDTGDPGSWVQVFDLNEGNADNARVMTAVELYDASAYVAYCEVCDLINKTEEQVIKTGLATNVGGDAPPAKASEAGWHVAAAEGLPDRTITSIEIDPANPSTIWVTLANYANRQWWPAGSFNDANPNLGEGHVFQSTDAGETFTDISGTLPDVPARWVELNNGQLLVGTDVGVFLSNNTDGERWAALAGMPRVPVTAIDNDPADPNRVVISTFGRGVYEYVFSQRAMQVTPTQPAPTSGTGSTAAPARGTLARTGLPGTVALLALASLGGAAVLRRRAAVD